MTFYDRFWTVNLPVVPWQAGGGRSLCLTVDGGPACRALAGRRWTVALLDGGWSFDFKMIVGTTICAARDGVVNSLEESYTDGGLKDKWMNKGNYIVIAHDDGTYGGYWHLAQNGALVSEGDTIVQGQLIGKSGHTGYSAFPHLHFWVYDENS